MSHRREYEIAFVGLKPGIHVFEYRIEDKFFTPYGEQDLKNCIAEVKLSLDKKNGFMQLHFDIDGTADVICDRCGNTLTKQLWDEFDIVVKIVDEPELMNEQEIDPDVYYISRSESHIYVADWIYEFINLSLPMQKRCSDEEMGGPQCNNEVLDKLKKMEDEVRKDNNNNLWKGLEKFKDLEN
jgi:uncharacterized metal-binding protein YceD (DUF177 family)